MPTFLRGCADKRALRLLDVYRTEAMVVFAEGMPTNQASLIKSRRTNSGAAGGAACRRGAGRNESKISVEGRKSTKIPTKDEANALATKYAATSNEGLILTKRGNAVAYWPAGWYSISRY